VTKQVILCIDDEQMILHALKIELKNVFGHQFFIETASSGKEALEIITELQKENCEIPLVITDYMMPNMKGDELLQHIHLLSPQTRNVMLTGQADIGAVTKTINKAKLYRYISKPWRKTDLILTVSEAIKSYRKEQQLTAKSNQLEKQAKTFYKFVPDQFLKLLNIKDINQIKLAECVEKTMSIMFADIRNFTTLSETMTPQENFNFINDYLSQMDPIIDNNNGFIDKYIGDEIMALFPNSADDAVKAAIGMLKQLVNNTITIGIGIHYGPLMLGTVGGQNRMDGTVISDAVNLASRVEGLTKTYKTPLLITEQVYNKLIDQNKYKIRIIDHVTVKGKTKPVTIYEVFDANPLPCLKLKLKTLKDFESGVKSFHQEQFAAANEHFKKVLTANENDLVAQIYLNNCEKILSITSLKIPHILIVDDTVFNSEILSRVLKNQNFQVSVANNGEQALEKVKQNPPNLILLDVMMPGIDGFETCRQLKANPKTEDIPIIFMTALSDTIDKVKGFELGAVDYITKPFHNEELLVRVETHLRVHNLQKQLATKNSELEVNNLELKGKINNLMYGF
jgi:DNA-binding response OmpR family regulator/class 3 adenylate cyclase